MKIKLRSIRSKFLIPTLALIVLGIGLSSTISYIGASKALDEVLEENIETQTKATIAVLESWMRDRTLDITNWSQQKVFQTAVKDSFMAAAARTAANELLTKLKNDYGYYENICLAMPNGDIVAAAEPSVIGKINVAERPYFKPTMQGQTIVSDVLQSRQSGNPVFAIATAVKEADQVIGLIFSVVDLAVFSKNFVDPVKIGQTGYLFMYNQAGLVIAHPDKANILKQNMSELDFGKKMMANKQGHLHYRHNGIEKQAAFKTADKLGWTVAATVPTDEIMAPVQKLGRVNLGVAMAVLLVAAGLLYIISRLVTGPLNQVVAGLRNAAEGEGDLTQRIAVRSRDEVGELARCFNAFVEKIQGIVGEVAGNAGHLTRSSQDLSAISTQLAGGADQTSAKATTVAAASEEMSANMTSVAAAMEQAASNMNMVASAAEEMTATINEIAQNTEKARTITEGAVGQAAKATEQVGQLGIAAQDIDKVVETITDISEQVNLLALNATIEAARAGEAGKGFAVVANEIKELARQTAEATGQIKQRVEGIRHSTDGTVSQIQTIANVVDEINKIVASIATAVEEQSVTTKEIAGNVAQSSAGMGEVNVNLAQSSQVAGQIAADIADVTKAAGEMSSSSGQVNANSAELAGLASQLNAMVGRFKI